MKNISRFSLEIEPILFNSFPNFENAFWEFVHGHPNHHTLEESYYDFLLAKGYTIHTSRIDGLDYFKLTYKYKILAQGSYRPEEALFQEYQWFKTFAGHFEEFIKS